MRSKNSRNITPPSACSDRKIDLRKISYKEYWFRSSIIQHGIWLDLRVHDIRRAELEEAVPVGAHARGAAVGERLAAPRIGASGVVVQFPYVPYSALQYAPAYWSGESLTSIQMAPNAMRKVPFIAPSNVRRDPSAGY